MGELIPLKAKLPERGPRIVRQAGPDRDLLARLIEKNVPLRFRQASFENFRTDTPAQDLALKAARKWLADVAKGPMLALIGPPGTGKSHLLYATAIELYKRWTPGADAPFVRPWYGFVDHLRYGQTVQYEGGSRLRDVGEVRGEWWGRPIVMLDEIRPTSATSFDDTELARYACHAYDHKRAVFVTTNVSPLEKVMGPAAADRFTQITVTGESGRQ